MFRFRNMCRRDDREGAIHAKICTTPERSITMRALVVTTDPLLLKTFGEVSCELGIECQSSDVLILPELLSNTRYAGVVLDFDTVGGAIPAVASIRSSRTNPNAVIFAVATNTARRDEALLHGAHFLLRRPLEALEIRQTLNSAYDLMYRERRRYFRCAAELPIALTLSGNGAPLKSSTINVSSDGVGIRSPIPLTLAQAVGIALTLPNGFVVSANGIVIWDDKHGKTGLKFSCRSPEMRQKLDSWLDSQFRETSSNTRWQ